MPPVAPLRRPVQLRRAHQHRGKLSDPEMECGEGEARRVARFGEVRDGKETALVCKAQLGETSEKRKRSHPRSVS